jgi:hypothetical protein
LTFIFVCCVNKVSSYHIKESMKLASGDYDDDGDDEIAFLCQLFSRVQNELHKFLHSYHILSSGSNIEINHSHTQHTHTYTHVRSVYNIIGGEITISRVPNYKSNTWNIYTHTHISLFLFGCLIVGLLSRGTYIRKAKARATRSM